MRLFQIELGFLSSALSRFAKNRSLISVQATNLQEVKWLNKSGRKKKVYRWLVKRQVQSSRFESISNDATLMLFFWPNSFSFLISRYLMGEEGYCLTTLVTALAYLATLKPT